MNDIDVFERICRRRRSVRAFLSKPIEASEIARILRVARTSPSSCNTQPWSVHVASGRALKTLSGALVEAARNRTPAHYEIPSAAKYIDEFRDRQIDAAKRLFVAQGVARDDLQARCRSMLKNFEFFDAPHAAFIFVSAGGGIREAADCGKFAQTFMLALAAANYGSCPQGALAMYPHIVRDTLGIEDEPGKLLLGLSFGRPDHDHPTAGVRPKRCDLAEFARFYE